MMTMVLLLLLQIMMTVMIIINTTTTTTMMMMVVVVVVVVVVVTDDDDDVAVGESPTDAEPGVGGLLPFSGHHRDRILSPCQRGQLLVSLVSVFLSPFSS